MLSGVKSTKSFRWLIIISLFVTQLDSGIISTNLSSMARELMLSAMQKGWVVSIYTIGLLLATPIMGNLIDRYGYRFVFLTELAFYFVGVMGIALSHSFPVLLVSRLIQAFGSSSLLTLAISLVFATYENKVASKVGTVGVWVSLATIVAPLASVISLARTHNWRSIYFVLALLIFVLFILGLWLMPKHQEGTVGSFDIKGNTVFAIGLVMFNLFLSVGIPRKSFLLNICLIVLSLLILWFFIKIETKRENEQKHVLISKRLWSNRLYRKTLFNGMVTGLVMSLFTFFPSFIEASYHVNSRRAGSFLTLMAVGTLIGAKIGGFWTEKRGALQASRGAMLCVAVSLILMFASLNSFMLFLVALILFGIAIGMVMSVTLQVMIVEISPDDRNVSLSLLSISKKMGMVLGITLVSLFAGLLDVTGIKAMLILLAIATLIGSIVLRKGVSKNV